MATGHALATAGSLERADFARFHEQARGLVSLSKAADIVVLSDATGQQLVNTLREFGSPLPRHGNLELHRRVISSGGPIISEIYIGGVLQIPVMSIDIPVIRDGSVAYDLSIGLMPIRFNRILEAQGLPSGWVAGVFDSTGTLAGRIPSPEKFVGQKGTAEFIRRIQEAPEGSMETISREGIPTLSAWSRSTATGWSVGIGIPRAELEASLLRTLYLLLAGIVILLAAGLAFAAMAARKIGGAVHALAAPALALGAGEYPPIPVLDIREPAAVADAIGRASELLKTRTAELVDANASLLAREADLRDAHRLARFGAWRWNIRSGEVVVSASMQEIMGREIPPIFEQICTLLPLDSWQRIQAVLQDVIRTGTAAELELEANHGQGFPIWLDVRCEPGRRVDGEIVELVGTALDITQRKQAELTLENTRRMYQERLEQQVAERTAELIDANAALKRLARTDALTGLPNRIVADERLHLEFMRLKRTGSPYAVLFMDIDHFKQINDTHGHETGDRALQRLGAVLQKWIRETDLVARFGGEEFLVILADTHPDAAMVIAEKIRQAVTQEEFPVVGQLSISIGISMARAEDWHEGVAVRRADQALYEAKAAGRNTVRQH